MNFDKMNRTFAIQRLQEENPKLRRDLVKNVKFKSVNKTGPFNKEYTVDLYIDDLEYNLVIYRDNQFHCIINKYLTLKLQDFLRKKEIPEPQECKQVLTQCI